eukprot:gene13531-15996_t
MSTEKELSTTNASDVPKQKVHHRSEKDLKKEERRREANRDKVAEDVLEKLKDTQNNEKDFDEEEDEDVKRLEAAKKELTKALRKVPKVAPHKSNPSNAVQSSSCLLFCLTAILAICSANAWLGLTDRIHAKALTLRIFPSFFCRCSPSAFRTYTLQAALWLSAALLLWQCLYLSTSADLQTKDFTRAARLQAKTYNDVVVDLLTQVERESKLLAGIRKRRETFEHRVDKGLKQAEAYQQSLKNSKLPSDVALVSNLEAEEIMIMADLSQSEEFKREEVACPNLAKRYKAEAASGKKARTQSKVMQRELEKVLKVKLDVKTGANKADAGKANCEVQLEEVLQRSLNRSTLVEQLGDQVEFLVKKLPEGEQTNWKLLMARQKAQNAKHDLEQAYDRSGSGVPPQAKQLLMAMGTTKITEGGLEPLPRVALGSVQGAGGVDGSLVGGFGGAGLMGGLDHATRLERAMAAEGDARALPAGGEGKGSLMGQVASQGGGEGGDAGENVGVDPVHARTGDLSGVGSYTVGKDSSLQYIMGAGTGDRDTSSSSLGSSSLSSSSLGSSSLSSSRLGSSSLSSSSLSSSRLAGSDLEGMMDSIRNSELGNSVGKQQSSVDDPLAYLLSASNV